MSVIAVFTIRLEPYIPAPALDSPFPIGEWRGVLNLAGDASGGYVGVTFAPASADEARKFLWSWEAASIRINTNLIAQLVAQLDLVTAEAMEAFGGSIEYYSAMQYITANAVTPSTAMAIGSFPENLKKIHRPRAGLTNSFTIYVDGNLGALVGYYFDAWGYIWHPQARTNAGGPRRR